jgi:formylglycine-generating enzyme required for sulfatase activity
MVVLFPNSLVFAEPLAGSLLEVKFDTPEGPFTLRFRYCSSGELLRGKPEPLPPSTGDPLLDLSRKARIAEMKGFYIAETETSQEQYQQVHGKEVINAIFERMVAADAGGRGSKYPIRGVNIFEAAKFCESVGQLSEQKAVQSSALEARSFRLPTHDEWQYACRAITDPNRTAETPHFNAWPARNAIPKNVLADCNDVWSTKLGNQTPFTGSQDQVVSVIEAMENKERGVELLSEFLRLALGTKRDYAIPLEEPQVVGTGKPNAWNVFNMHGNVFEWTLVEKDKGRLSSIFETLAHANGQPLDIAGENLFFLAGGGYNHGMDQNVSDWRTFSIWGGYYLKESKPAPISLDRIESDNIVQDSVPGFRVLLERVLADDWLFVVRKTTVLNKNDTLELVQKNIVDQRRIVAELCTRREYAVADARISFYEALEMYRRGDRLRGATQLSKATPILAEGDAYYVHLQKLMESDVE